MNWKNNNNSNNSENDNPPPNHHYYTELARKHVSKVKLYVFTYKKLSVPSRQYYSDI